MIACQYISVIYLKTLYLLLIYTNLLLYNNVGPTFPSSWGAVSGSRLPCRTWLGARPQDKAAWKSGEEN